MYCALLCMSLCACAGVGNNVSWCVQLKSDLLSRSVLAGYSVE